MYCSCNLSSIAFLTAAKSSSDPPVLVSSAQLIDSAWAWIREGSHDPAASSQAPFLHSATMTVGVIGHLPYLHARPSSVQVTASHSCSGGGQLAAMFSVPGKYMVPRSTCATIVSVS